MFFDKESAKEKQLPLFAVEDQITEEIQNQIEKWAKVINTVYIF